MRRDFESGLVEDSASPSASTNIASSPAPSSLTVSSGTATPPVASSHSFAATFSAEGDEEDESEGLLGNRGSDLRVEFGSSRSQDLDDFESDVHDGSSIRKQGDEPSSRPIKSRNSSEASQSGLCGPRWPGDLARDVASRGRNSSQILLVLFMQRGLILLAVASLSCVLVDALSQNTGPLLRPAGLSLLLVIFTLVYYRDTRESWVLEGVAERSILVSCAAFQGSLSLVPDGRAVADFFAEKYGPVENVLMLLDVGKLIRLGRLRSELRNMANAAERDQQRWRPLHGIVPRLPCCRVCRRMARRAGDRRQDRLRRWTERIDERLADLENTHQTESLGCAIVTFECAKDAHAVMRDSINAWGADAEEDEFLFFHSDDDDELDDVEATAKIGAHGDDTVSNPRHVVSEDSEVVRGLRPSLRSPRLGLGSAGKPKGIQRDHARRWWFTTPRELRSYFGEEPVFVRSPPPPSDLNFEVMQPDTDFGRAGPLRITVIGIFASFFILLGLALGSSQRLPLAYEDEIAKAGASTGFEFVVGILGAITLYFALFLPLPSFRILPERAHLTFSQVHADHFEISTLFVLLFIVSMSISALGQGVNCVTYAITIVFQLTSLLRASWRLVRRVTVSSVKGNLQGVAQAEAFALVALPAFVCTSYTSVLVWAAIGLCVRLLIEDAIAWRITKALTTEEIAANSSHLSPNIAVSSLYALSVMACLVVALPTVLHVSVGKDFFTSPSADARALYLATLMSGLSFAFLLACTYVEYVRPARSRAPPETTYSFMEEDNFPESPVTKGVPSMSPAGSSSTTSVSIAFGSDTGNPVMRTGSSFSSPSSIHDPQEEIYRIPQRHDFLENSRPHGRSGHVL
mmetsp:Transcript_4366/g.9428  ORF Transcript_4366/g.9428 Transcript_4366/m.9428 type:complete len:860 (-) Transcript_4366:372-2951(-)